MFKAIGVGYAPDGKLIENRADRTAKFGHAVLHLWRNLAIDIAFDQAEFFEVAELLRKHFFRDFNKRSAEFAKTHRLSIVEFPQDSPLPFPAEHFYARLDRAKVQ